MVKLALALGAVAVTGLVVWKLLWALLLPLLVGVVAVAAKLLVLALVGLLAYWLYRRLDRRLKIVP